MTAHHDAVSTRCHIKLDVHVYHVSLYSSTDKRFLDLDTGVEFRGKSTNHLLQQLATHNW